MSLRRYFSEELGYSIVHHFFTALTTLILLRYVKVHQFCWNRWCIIKPFVGCVTHSRLNLFQLVNFFPAVQLLSYRLIIWSDIHTTASCFGSLVVQQQLYQYTKKKWNAILFVFYSQLHLTWVSNWLCKNIELRFKNPSSVCNYWQYIKKESAFLFVFHVDEK